MKTAIILNLWQAEIFSRQQDGVEKVVSFCPTATHFLQERNYQVISTATLYGAVSHAKVVALVARELKEITQAAATQYQLDYTETEGLSVYLYHYLCCVYHLHFALRSYKKMGGQLVWVNKKTLEQGDYASMFAALAAQPSPVITAYAYTGYGIAHYLLAAFYNAILYTLIARSKRLKVMDYGDELPKRIIKSIIDGGENPLVLNTHTVCKRPYKTTRFFFKSITRICSAKPDGKPIYIFRAAFPTKYKVKPEAFHIPGMHAREVQSIVQKLVEKFIPFTRTEVAMGRKIIKRARPQLCVSDHAKYGYILGGLEELKNYGGQHAMLNHGTHTIQYDAISKVAANLWGAQERIINRNTTHCLPKSPLTAAMAREIRPDGYQLCKINVYGRIENKASPTGKFVVLQAGNYTDAFNHIPWCKETADEYLLAIVELLEEVGKLDNVELIIKLKNKKADTHKKIVEAHIKRLGIEDKARVDTTSKFSDLMARAHIVVCNLSGTIEEALANHIPMMIHTYRKSYFHIAGHTANASSKGSVAPAYLIKKRSDIGEIITRLSGLRAQLNDPELYRGVAWQEGERIEMRDLAAQLVRDAKRVS